MKYHTYPELEMPRLPLKIIAGKEGNVLGARAEELRIRRFFMLVACGERVSG